MYEQFIKRVVELTNIERRKAGLPALKYNPVLAAAAEKHSVDMAMQDYFDHEGSDGSSVSDRISAMGYQWSFVAENIQGGSDTPEEAVQSWMNSPGHRKNILNSKAQEIGVGYYFLANDTGDVKHKHYWTQVFAKPA
jgi:uncharacterized protein YkwD